MKLFVPGRLCLFGEHSDWAATYDVCTGACITVGLGIGIRARVSFSAEWLKLSTRIVSGPTKTVEIEMTPEALKVVAKSRGFFSYAAGAAYQASCHTQQEVGLHVSMSTDLPIRKGLASSAAVCVLIVRAFNKMFEYGFDVKEEMERAFQGEHMTGSMCGRMDQICAYGPVLSLLQFNNKQVSIETHRLEELIYIVLVDLNGRKNTRRILKELNLAYASGNTTIQQALGSDNLQIVDEAIPNLVRGNAEKVGELMRKAQAIFDAKIAPLSPRDLTAPKLHEVLELPSLQDLTYGGKGVGSQGDGTVQLVAKGKKEQQEIRSILREKGMKCYPLTLGETTYTDPSLEP